MGQNILLKKAFFIFYFIIISGAQLAGRGGGGEVSPALFLRIGEKCPDFAKESALILE